MTEAILVVLWRPETAAALLAAATRLATLSGGARVSVIAAAEPAATGVSAGPAFFGDTGAAPAGTDRVAALREAFDRWRETAGTAGVPARWIAEEGNISAIVAERGARADIIVTAQPADGEREPRALFRAALLGTDRPVLMVPPGATATFGRRVAIAWRDDKRVAAAVLAALRWVPHAEKVEVLIGVRPGSPPPAVPRILVEHGLVAALHVLPIGAAPFGRALLATAHETGADLLVMGAYAHSPLRELILGGVTHYMAAHADLPVLMRH